MLWAQQSGSHGYEDEDASKAASDAGKSVRTITGRCWMAEDFPMSLQQLLPILSIVGNANKHLARVGKFLEKYGNMDLFPVKLQVCLHWPFCLKLPETSL